MKKLLFFKKTTLALIAVVLVSAISYAQTTNPSVNLLYGDIKATITGATTSADQTWDGIENSYDNDPSTIYHSPYNGTTFPVILTYNINPADIDMVIYTTRPSKGASEDTNGNFKEFSISIKKERETNYTKVLDVDLKGESGSHRIKLPSLQEKVVSIQFILEPGATDKEGTDIVSCAEMAFCKAGPEFDPSSIFADVACTILKPEITQTEISALTNEYYKALAQQLFDGTYPKEFRINEFKAWPHPDGFAWPNRLNMPYSLCDNPTGIYMRPGDKIAVFAENLGSIPVSLRLKNYNEATGGSYESNTDYLLSNGINIIHANREGLLYVQYFTPNHLTAEKIKLHFAFANVAGYFDNQIHKKEDWTRILNANKYTYMDVVGAYAHLTFPTANYKRSAANTGLELINLYDDMVYKLRDFMGFYKYNRNPYNRNHFIVVYHMYMYATAYRTAYNVSTLDHILNVNTLKSSPWGPAHEVGHVNQHNPLFRWVGTTEVTNNVQALLIQTAWGNDSRLIREDRYQEAYDHLMAPKIANANAGIWQQLVPLWQIQLFFAEVLGKTDTYAKIYEACRTWGIGNGPGSHQMTFTKILVDSTKTDLTEFLDAWGYLRTIDNEVSDYTSAQFTITEEDLAELKQYIKDKNFPKPEYKIQYITDVNKHIYKDKLNVVQGTHTQNASTFTPSGWQNVVAYECYRDGELVYIVRGDMSGEKSFTFPGRFDNTCELYAVQYDGKKIKMADGFGNPLPKLEAPKFSTSDTEHWYYIKNMSGEQTNSQQGATPRGFCSLHATGEGQVVTGKSLPIFETQKWKLQRISPTTFALVNEDGLYLGIDMRATKTIPSSEKLWQKLDYASKQGTSGYRFVSSQINPTNNEKEDIIAHLQLNGNLTNYTPSDEASLWQFVPADLIKLTDNENTYDYNIQTIRNDEAVADSYLQKSATEDKAITALDDSDNWNIIASKDGAVHLRNKDNKYLGTTSLVFPFMKDTPTNYYLYLTNYDGFVGVRIATGTSATASVLNVNASNSLAFRSTKDLGSVWQFTPSVINSVETLNANAAKYKIYVQDRKVVVSEVAGEFAIYSISGQQVKNENLANGVYIVKGTDFATKVLVK